MDSENLVRNKNKSLCRWDSPEPEKESESVAQVLITCQSVSCAPYKITLCKTV